MSQFLVILMFVAMVATFAVMVAGIFVMAKGGEASRRNSNRLMQMRVTFQAIALAALALLVMN
jgi:flagellar basal body-associated protein FliL